MDLPPTVFQLAGSKIPKELVGTSLLSGELKAKAASQVIFFEGLLYGQEKKGILKKGWKLIENTGEIRPMSLHIPKMEADSEASPKFELYNTNTDFFDRDNVIDKFPRIAIELRKLLKQMKIATLDSASITKAEKKKKLEDLKSLGYIE
jgi:hypothetical protein